MYTKGFGYSGIVERNSLDPQVVFNTGCMTQSLTAMTLSLMEQSGQISWDTPLSKYLPDFQTRQGACFDDQALLRDLLSHSTGLAAAPLAIRGKHSAVVAKTRDMQQVFNNLPPISQARTEWNHNEWGYTLATQIIDERSGKPWEYCVDNIIGRLGYPRTYMNHQIDYNYAPPCHILADGTPVPLDNVYKDHGHGLEGSGSIRTCVNDMLHWCVLLLMASKEKRYPEEETPLAIFPVSSSNADTLTKERLLKAAWQIQQPTFVISKASPTSRSQAYGMGLFKFKLPTRIINKVSNVDSVAMKKYTMGRNSFPRDAIGNTSDLGTYTSTYWVFPGSDSAVIVLSNGNSANGDCTSIISQVLTQALFNLQPQINYLEIAEQVSFEAKAQWQTAQSEWIRHKRPDVKAKPLSAYAGNYISSDLQMTLSITTSPATQRANGDTGRIQGDDSGRMKMCINSLDEQIFDLYHYHGDNWTFMPSSRDECLKQGYGSYIQSWRSFIIKFDDFCNGRFWGVRWFLDPDPRVRAFHFERASEGRPMPKSPSSVYSQPESMDVEESSPRRSSATLVDYAGTDSSMTLGRYSDFIQ